MGFNTRLAIVGDAAKFTIPHSKSDLRIMEEDFQSMRSRIQIPAITIKSRKSKHLLLHLLIDLICYISSKRSD
jgi:hypothetical protein